MIGLLAGAALYSLAGFLIAPRAIKLWIESPYVSGPTCRLRVREVYVNPFTMFVSLQNVTLFDQENKLFVSAMGAETDIWTVGMLRAERPGRDVAIRELVVTDASGDETILTAPGAFARNVRVGAGGVLVDAAYVHLEQPDATIARDAAGIRHRPAWLSLPGDDRTGACISLDAFEASRGRLRLTDDGVSPSVQLELRDVVAEAHHKPGRGGPSVEINVEGRSGTAGTISLAMELRRPTGRHPDVFSMNARNVDLHPFSPYFRRGFGRDIVAGFGDAALRHERDGEALRFDNRLVVDGLKLSAPQQDASDEALLLDLAIALATGTSDRSEILIQGSTGDSPTHSVPGVFADSLRAHLESLAASPFGVLAELVGEPDVLLDEIAFLPGSAEMASAAKGAVALLANGLRRRPRLGIGIRPGYDPAADRDAIAAQQVRLHIALATSENARETRDSAAPDFDNPRVRDVLEEFANLRLPEDQRLAIERDVHDEASMYRDFYRALIANERVSETVLRRLARFRARSVIDALARDGVDRNRMRMTDALDKITTDAETVSLKVEAEARR